jgi:formamidopyrimidine-DNA glycosylase
MIQELACIRYAYDLLGYICNKARSEALFKLGIHPFKKVNELTNEQLNMLNHIDVNMLENNVFGKQKYMGLQILRKKIHSRSVYYVPMLQA